MSGERLISAVRESKEKLQNEGIAILGIFGSYARGDYTKDSDIDILYEIPNPEEFAKQHGGFGAFAKIEEIKESLGKILGKKVDLTAKSSLNEVGKKYILRDLQYV